MIKPVTVDKVKIQLVIFDIGAQEQFQSMRAKYFQGSNASIAVFDITNPGDPVRKATLLRMDLNSFALVDTGKWGVAAALAGRGGAWF